MSLTVLQHLSEFPFFLGLSNISLCVYNHTLFIRSSLDRHLGCFCLLLFWVMLLWTWGYKSLFETLLSVLLGVYPGVELLDQMVLLFLIFWDTPGLISMDPAPFCISTSDAQGFLLFHTPSNTSYYYYFLIVSYPNGHEVFICIFLVISGGEYFFICSLAIWMSSLEKYLFKFFVHF